MQFLTEVLSIGRRSLNFGTVNEIVKKHVVNYGGELLYQCLHACVFTLSANLRYDVSNLIKSLIQLDSTVSFNLQVITLRFNFRIRTVGWTLRLKDCLRIRD